MCPSPLGSGNAVDGIGTPLNDFAGAQDAINETVYFGVVASAKYSGQVHFPTAMRKPPVCAAE